MTSRESAEFNDLLFAYRIATEHDSIEYQAFLLRQFVDGLTTRARQVRAFSLSERPLPLRQPHTSRHTPPLEVRHGHSGPASR